MIRPQEPAPIARAKKGHNSGSVIPGRLKSFVERIEKLIEERKAIGGDIADVYAEAKGIGYDVGTMRKVIRLRDMDVADRAEQEALLDVYLHALGMVDRVEARVASGESIRKAAAAEGMPKSTAIRRVTQNAPHPEIVENGSVAEPVAPAPPAVPDTAEADMMAAAAHLESLKREKGFAA